MTQTILEIYNKLLNYYGKQNWWPAETKFEVIIGAILTQNTAWSNVEKAIKNLKEKNLLTPEEMHKLKFDELAKNIKSSGFFRQKALKIFAFLDFFQKYNFDLKKLKRENNLRNELLKIKGIGPETADSILLYALDMPFFVVDSYTKRLFYRLGIIDNEKISYHNLQEIFHKNLPEDVETFKEYHALIVAHAKKYCKKKPECKLCPIKKFCKFYRELENGSRNYYY